MRTLIAASATALAFVAGQAAAEDLVFMLDNQSSYDVIEFYASPVEASSWEDDILGADILPSGGAVRVTIADGRTICEYDLLITFADGDTLEDGAVDLCATGSYTITD